MIDERPQDLSRASGANDDRSLSLALAEPAKPQASPYRILARKYRPSTFADLIGQEPMVRTLSNAFDLDRIHQAYILTGVRGVGKTTTARILARAFNYDLPDAPGRPGIHQPTVRMPELGTHCQAIIESRHVDVMEMDAASHTGIENMREIIESARYRPVSARTKVYIIDEVHMLSKSAFNGLLKTLEEPPEHLKFVFATTEIDKVPITVRSRCQRFDLRRIEADVLIAYLAGICAKEGVAADAEALALIARAAEGSVRDSLSLLDQAIAHGSEGRIEAESLKAMLGLADRGVLIDLFEWLMRGKIAAALALMKAQYDHGADPGRILVELADFVHFVTRLKLVPEAANDPAASPEERRRGLAFAERLGMAVLTRTFQLLLKGIADMKDSPRPLASAEMVLVRLAFAADLPPPDEVIRKLQQSELRSPSTVVPSPQTSSAPQPNSAAQSLSRGRETLALAASSSPQRSPAEPRPSIGPTAQTLHFEDVVALAERHRDIQLKIALERDVRLVRFEPGQIEFALVPGGSPQLAAQLTRRLSEWTGMRWIVAISSQPGAPSLKEAQQAREQAALSGVRSDPLVQSVLERFPGAEIVGVRRLAQNGEDVELPPGSSNEDISYDSPDLDDDP
jgi:DNA polymerase-3 subunit gamma/tau